MYKKIENEIFLWERHIFIYSNIYYDYVKFVIFHKKGEIDSFLKNFF